MGWGCQICDVSFLFSRVGVFWLIKGKTLFLWYRGLGARDDANGKGSKGWLIQFQGKQTCTIGGSWSSTKTFLTNGMGGMVKASIQVWIIWLNNWRQGRQPIPKFWLPENFRTIILVSRRRSGWAQNFCMELFFQNFSSYFTICGDGRRKKKNWIFHKSRAGRRKSFFFRRDV